MRHGRSYRKQSAPASVSRWAGFAAVVIVLVLAAMLATRQYAPQLVTPAAAQTRPVAQPYTPRHIYDVNAKPAAVIADALDQAKREHKRVILDFGGDWCGDCQVLDIYFHQAPNAELLEKNFVLVHVWIGHMDANVDVAERYGVPLKKGVPALAVLSADGKTLSAQKTGEFEDMRHMDSSSVTEFLTKWKG